MHFIIKTLTGTLVFILLLGFLQQGRAEIRVQVVVEGVDKNLTNNVLSSLTIEKRKDHPHLTEGLIRRLHEKAPEEIRPALQPFGFYDPSIQSELKKEGNTWVARYRIDPGNPVRIKGLDLQIQGPGADNQKFQTLIRNFPLKEGDPLNHGNYEKAKRRLLRLALNIGYLDAALAEHRVQVFTEENRADISLHLETGPQYFFGKVTFHQDAFRQEFVERFAEFKNGDPYSQHALFSLQNALHDGNYFRTVEVKPRRDLIENLEVPVDVLLEPRKRNQYTLGLGYGTDTGVRGSLGWESRRINNRGHYMDSELKLSEVKDSFTTRYIVPLENPLTEHLDYTAGWYKERTDTSVSEIYLLGVGHHHLRRDWKETFYLNYQQERFTVAEKRGRSNLLIPGISWTRIRADDRIYTTKGYRALLQLRGAHESFISDTSFFQVRLQTKLIYGLGDVGRLILRGEGGTTWIDEFSDLPASVRFFAGGDQSVRGYAYRSLGPTDSNGEVIGGKHLVVGSIEYEHRLPKKWSTALFYDVGNAIDSIGDPYAKGAGIGIRWRSPVGLIRLDLASALSKPGNPWRIHLTIGPDL